MAFIKLKNGSRFSFFTKIIEDLTRPGSQSVIDDLYYMHIPLGFNGMMLYYSLDQQYLNGYHYTNGFIDGAVAFSSKTSQGPATNNLEVHYASVCTTYDVYETFCSYGGPQDDPRRYVTYCTETLISSVTVCQDNGGGSGGVCSGCGSGSGSGTTNPNPCAPISNPPVAVQSVANGRVTVHFVPIPPTGGGGGTTAPPCPSNQGTGTWASNLILNIPPPGEVISNVADYLKCFDKTTGAVVTIYIDQPTANSSTTWSGSALNPDVGHTFVSIQQNGITRVFGFYPNGGVNPLSSTPTAPAALVDDSGHPYDVKITINPVSAAQLTSIINYTLNKPSTYNLNTYNCTDFGINIAAKANVALPDHSGSWPGGAGSNPGNLGQDVRAMSNGSNTSIKNSGGTAVSNSGTCK